MPSNPSIKGLPLSPFSPLLPLRPTRLHSLQLYSQMRKEGHKADVVTFGTLVTACEKDLDVPRAAAVWQEFKQEGVKANQVGWGRITLGDGWLRL